jgi:TatD DNase family protein
MFVDSHCHLDCIKLDEFNGDYGEMLRQAADAGVEHMLCVSIDFEKFPAMLAQAEPFSQISVSAGVHPMADRANEIDEASLRRYACHDRVVAIGETGLDYYYHKGDREWQQQRFRTHLRIAREFGKPVIVHTRDAGEDTLEILAEENARQCGGVIHCFTETMDFAERAMDMGLMISFSGIITFNNADALRQVARQVPDEFLLIETDSPYLAPAPHRGKQNYPAYVRRVAEKLAEIRDVPVEHIAQLTRDNFYRTFRLVT